MHSAKYPREEFDHGNSCCQQRSADCKTADYFHALMENATKNASRSDREDLFVQELNLAFTGDDGLVGHVQKEAVLDDADDGANGSRESRRVKNLSARAIENQVSFVGD